VGPTWSVRRGYRTPSQWEAFSQVGKDFYDNGRTKGDVPDSKSVAASAARPVKGVHKDFDGNKRSSSGSWAAGAFEVR
jgi:hypothetical protein